MKCKRTHVILILVIVVILGVQVWLIYGPSASHGKQHHVENVEYLHQFEKAGFENVPQKIRTMSHSLYYNCSHFLQREMIFLRDIEKYDGMENVVRVKILNNQLLVRQAVLDDPTDRFIDGMALTLISMLQRYSLPNVDFLINLQDLCCRIHDVVHFAVCKDRSAACKTIPVPSYSIEDGFKYWKSDYEWLFKYYASHYPWDSKLNTSVWRGSPSDLTSAGDLFNFPRAKLVKLSTIDGNKEFLDAVFVFNAGPEMERIYTEHKMMNRSAFMHSSDFMRYKYIVDVDGKTWSNRFAHVLAFNSVTLKQESVYTEPFQLGMTPYVHYVPIKSDFSDLIAKIQFLRKHDDIARQIVHNAQLYGMQHASMESVMQYWFEALTEYAKIQAFEPKWEDGFAEVTISWAKYIYLLYRRWWQVLD